MSDFKYSVVDVIGTARTNKDHIVTVAFPDGNTADISYKENIDKLRFDKTLSKYFVSYAFERDGILQLVYGISEKTEETANALALRKLYNTVSEM